MAVNLVGYTNFDCFTAIEIRVYSEMLLMVSKRKIATTAAATFGAAMASMYVAPELQADVVDITYNGGNATASNPFFAGSGVPIPQDIDQVGGSSDFGQWNDTFGGSGRTFTVGTGIVSLGEVFSGDVLDPGTFTGAGAGGGSQFDGSGSAFIGFRSAAGNVGYFEISFTQGGAIIYGAGEYGSSGGPVTVGVPEPASAAGLATLALGAASIRRRRK